ncbi:MAG TPA: hypothetical protein VJO16_02055 [Candidatus Acidoferrum sp.]|nr:hypothetical protein [Candidatus Acidoferrum sp.]
MHQLRGSLEEQRVPFSPAATPSESYPRLFFWCVVLVLGLLNVWARRNDVTPDGLSYIEIGWATARGGLHQLVNAYWSPVYSFLLSLIFRLFHPAVQWEFTTAHLLNFAIYVASFASFGLFLKELNSQREQAGELAGKYLPVSPRTLWVWGCIFFLWANYFWLGPPWVTPDLCVSVLVYLATALLFRIRSGRGGWIVFAGLGVLLGLGYLAKAAMFPLAFVFLFSAFCLSRIASSSLLAATLRTLVATVLFAGIALPFIFALSAVKGRPTFGDSGRINYAEFVNRATRSAHWQGEPAGTGTPLHASRKIFSNPDVFEFSSPVPGSYPPWYDPSYWYDGVRPHFSVTAQAWALFRASNMYLKIFSKSGALWVVLVTILVARRKLLGWSRSSSGAWLVFLPSMAALAMYSLVLVEFRYVAPFALMLLMWALSRMKIATGAGPLLVKRFHFVVLLAPTLAITWAAGRDLYEVVRNKPYEPWLVAQRLHEMGIPPGTDVGYIGTGLDGYWAHLAGVRIIAEIPDEKQSQFIAANAARRQKVLALFSSVGAKAVITKNADAANSTDGWRPIPGTHHYVWQQPLLIAAPDKM